MHTPRTILHIVKHNPRTTKSILPLKTNPYTKSTACTRIFVSFYFLIFMWFFLIFILFFLSLYLFFLSLYHFIPIFISFYFLHKIWITLLCNVIHISDSTKCTRIFVSYYFLFYLCIVLFFSIFVSFYFRSVH